MQDFMFIGHMVDSRLPFAERQEFRDAGEWQQYCQNTMRVNFSTLPVINFTTQKVIILMSETIGSGNDYLGWYRKGSYQNEFALWCRVYPAPSFGQPLNKLNISSLILALPKDAALFVDMSELKNAETPYERNILQLLEEERQLRQSTDPDKEKKLQELYVKQKKASDEKNISAGKKLEMIVPTS